MHLTAVSVVKHPFKISSTFLFVSLFLRMLGFEKSPFVVDASLVIVIYMILGRNEIYYLWLLSIPVLILEMWCDLFNIST